MIPRVRVAMVASGVALLALAQGGYPASGIAACMPPPLTFDGQAYRAVFSDAEPSARLGVGTFQVECLDQGGPPSEPPLPLVVESIEGVPADVAVVANGGTWLAYDATRADFQMALDAAAKGGDGRGGLLAAGAALLFAGAGGASMWRHRRHGVGRR